MMPVMPPITNRKMNPIEYTMGTVKRTRPRNMVHTQSYTLTPVGMPISIEAMPNAALIWPDWPIVKKWCSQTRNDRNATDMVAITSDG